MEAQCEIMNGLNLNPLAPAKSKHTFPFSEKTRNFNENASIPAPFFCPFLHLFQAFSRKVEKGSKVRPQSRKKTPKWDPKVPKWSPGVTKLSPKGPESTKNQQHGLQGTRNGAPGATLEPQGAQKCKTHIKNSPKLQNKNIPEGGPRGQTKKKNHIPTNNQPTKETKRDTKKQTIEQTHTRTRASNCKHKHKLPRPGARRRRRRSGRGFSERTL